MVRTVFCLLLICLGTPGVLLAQSADEKAVAERVETLRQVMIKPDAAILEDLAADELEYVHSSGTVRDKKGFVDEFMKGQSVFTAIIACRLIPTSPICRPRPISLS